MVLLMRFFTTLTLSDQFPYYYFCFNYSIDMRYGFKIQMWEESVGVLMGYRFQMYELRYKDNTQTFNRQAQKFWNDFFQVYKARDVGVNSVVLFPKIPDALKVLSCVQKTTRSTLYGVVVF